MTPRVLTALAPAIVLILPLACGGATAADSPGDGAGAGGQPALGTGGTDGDGAGGQPATGTGGLDDGGAGSGESGGASLGGEPGSGGSPAGCAPAPIARLMPRIGPFWFGPDPGPCSSTSEGATFSYASGLLESSTLNGGETYLRDDENRVIEAVSGADPASFEYVDNQIFETRGPQQVVYTLSPDGYPLTADVSMEGQSGFSRYTYHYTDCRLTLRDAPGAEADRTYGYDSEGHLITVSDGTSVTTYDYGCW